MGWYLAVGLIFVVNIVILVLRARAKLGGSVRAGDFFKVDIPRKAEAPLAMGTRLDCASVLKKAGVPRDELGKLIDGNHDQELLDRYWKLMDEAKS
jgi:hypothetical protein